MPSCVARSSLRMSLPFKRCVWVISSVNPCKVQQALSLVIISLEEVYMINLIRSLNKKNKLLYHVLALVYLRVVQVQGLAIRWKHLNKTAIDKEWAHFQIERAQLIMWLRWKNQEIDLEQYLKEMCHLRQMKIRQALITLTKYSSSHIDLFRLQHK